MTSILPDKIHVSFSRSDTAIVSWDQISILILAEPPRHRHNNRSIHYNVIPISIVTDASVKEKAQGFLETTFSGTIPRQVRNPEYGVFKS